MRLGKGWEEALFRVMVAAALLFLVLAIGVAAGGGR